MAVELSFTTDVACERVSGVLWQEQTPNSMSHNK
jgi:hypothetical protein